MRANFAASSADWPRVDERKELTSAVMAEGLEEGVSQPRRLRSISQVRIRFRNESRAVIHGVLGTLAAEVPTIPIDHVITPKVAAEVPLKLYGRAWRQRLNIARNN
ncbi:hypothetical protein QQ045_011698 [Rhodiola kirilowii]